MADIKKLKYELMVLIPNNLAETERAGLEAKIVQLLENNGGNLIQVENMGEKDLAYPINDCKRGIYTVYKFENYSYNILEIKKELSRIKQILRYLLIKQK